ncbi:MAG: single-stranded-DNA-specific exonuclease RecJ [Sandaracinaceae bacterium]|nr:single-stranded-DNA-specific exonuclease RecJ [Sandaracinaceae bacterium]
MIFSKQTITSDQKAISELAQQIGISSTFAQILLCRGLKNESQIRQFIYPTLSELSSPYSILDYEKALERIADSIRRKERILVFGDYDVDGTTSAALLSEFIELAGGHVTVLQANRFFGGYGLSSEALSMILEAKPSLVITCDCGSTDHERVEILNRAGIDVIVVDHHNVPLEPLPAYAFINPRRDEQNTHFHNFSTAGLAFLIAAGVRRKLGQQIDVRRFLDLVALGTVADVVPLNGDNRRLVRAGLSRLGSGKVRPGIAALMETARLKAPIKAHDIAFRLGPRLNAPGRLEGPSLAFQLLRSTSLHEAHRLARQIEDINEKRKAIQEQMVAEALAQAWRQHNGCPRDPIVVASPHWHKGVVGIVAARLVQQFMVPCIVIAIEGEEGHGSGRAPAGFPLYRTVLETKPWLLSVGGHDAAVGLRISRDAIPGFREAFARATRQKLFCAHLQNPSPEVFIDGERFPLPSPHELWLLEPVGHGNPEPVAYIDGVEVKEWKRIGQTLQLDLYLGLKPLRAHVSLDKQAQLKLGKRSLIGTLYVRRVQDQGEVEVRVIDFYS